MFLDIFKRVKYYVYYTYKTDKHIKNFIIIYYKI